MNPDEPSSRRKLLFLSFTYPSSGGSGSQLRAASLVRMLAKDADIYLIIAGYSEKVTGPPDLSLEAICRKIIYLRVLAGAESSGTRLPSSGTTRTVALQSIDCPPGKAAERIVGVYQDNNLDSLFVFRFDALHFVYDRLDSFPVRYLDLDELPSRGQAQIASLMGPVEGDNSGVSKRVGRATIHMMEKMLIPRFHRVFVASPLEAEEVRRRIGFQHPLVLPNVYPARPGKPEKRTVARNEILFVGSFFYYPNVDAVLYFCREILPLIQEKKGETVLFRIVGMGGTKDLECVRNQPGVLLAGYQENLIPCYAEAAVVVVPLRAGVGTRLKILEAFVHRRPVVSTSIGAEGLDVTDRENILLADGPDVFAQACIEVMDNPALAERICESAARLHCEHYSQEALERCYAKITANEVVPSPAVTG